MLKKRYQRLVFRAGAALLVSLSLVDFASSQALLSRENALEDAGMTEALVKKYHANLYAHRNAKQIASIWSNARAQLPENPNYLDAVTLIQKMLAAVCDEHTDVTLKDPWIYGKGAASGYFGSGLVIVKQKLYLDNFQFGKNGREIVGINARSSGEIIEFLRSITSADGCQTSDVLFAHQRSPRIVPILLTNFLGSGSSFTVKFKNAETGAISTADFQAVRWSALERSARSRAIRGRSVPLNLVNIETRGREWEFAADTARQALVRSDAEKSIYYIYLPSFNGGEAQAKYLDKEIRALVEAQPEHVIVDLTDNFGGKLGNAQQFMSYFLRTSSRIGVTIRTRTRKNISDSNFTWHSKRYREVHANNIAQFRQVRKKGGQYRLNVLRKSYGNKSYGGKLTVLVSPRTHSAATSVATILKRKAGAKIVGDIGDASMTTTCSGSLGAHRLPQTGAAILVPLHCVDRHGRASREGNLLQPDIPVDMAAQNSGKTNVAILSAALRSLDLIKVTDTGKTAPSASKTAGLSSGPGPGRAPKTGAGSGKVGKPLRKPIGSSSQRGPAFSISTNRISVELSGPPYKKGTAWLGVGVADIARLDFGAPEFSTASAVLITKVYAGGAADKYGFRAGDIVLSVGDTEIRDAESASRAISLYRPGKKVVVKFLRLADTKADLIRVLDKSLAASKDPKIYAYILGCLYAGGDFGEAKKKDAALLLTLAADAGSADAAAMLGHQYGGNPLYAFLPSGKNIFKRDIDLAMKYYTRAAALADSKAMFLLAELYDYNKRSTVNPKLIAYRRVQADSGLAASYLLHAYQGRYGKAGNALFDSSYTWSKDVRVAVKRLLHARGIYDGAFDGGFDATVRQAIARLRTEDVTLPELPWKPAR